LIIARCGYVWLPIGSPSGFARSRWAEASRTAVVIVPAPARSKKSRREMSVMSNSGEFFRLKAEATLSV
jgi:hypothetical protein